jgi:hypothetical protein
MRRRIVRSRDAVRAFGDYAAVFRDDGGEGPAAGSDIFESQRNRPAHEFG